jgi:citrate lyase subunit beta/citryl-CoA lyase
MSVADLRGMIRGIQARHRAAPEMTRGALVPYHRRGEMSVPAFTMAPGGDPATDGRTASLRLMQKVCAHPVDLFFFDCEDAAPDHPAFKSFARTFAADALTSFDFGERIVGFRPNNIRTDYFEDDIVEVITRAGHRVQVVIIPKTEQAAEVEDIIRIVRRIQRHAGHTNTIHFEVLIESPRGLMDAERIAALDGVTALILGPFDFARTTGGTVDPELWTRDLAFVRQYLPVAAAAHGKEAVDAITATLPIRPPRPDAMAAETYHSALAMDPATAPPGTFPADFLAALHRRSEALKLARTEAESARRCGYAAKWILHPDQIAPVQGAWTPSRETAEAALHLVAGYARAALEGSGVELSGNRLTDKAVVGADWWLVRAALRGRVLTAADIAATGLTIEELERTVHTRSA